MLGFSQPWGDLGARPSGRRIRAREAAIRSRPKKSISTNASLHAVFHDLSLESSVFFGGGRTCLRNGDIYVHTAELDVEPT